MWKGTEVKLHAFYVSTLDAECLNAVAALTQSKMSVLFEQDVESVWVQWQRVTSLPLSRIKLQEFNSCPVN
jgi:hypothetical protein